MCTVCRPCRPLAPRSDSRLRRRSASRRCSCSSSARRRPLAHSSSTMRCSDRRRHMPQAGWHSARNRARGWPRRGIRGARARCASSMTLSSCSPAGAAWPCRGTARCGRARLGPRSARRARARVLRRLAIFAGSFTLEAASAVAASAEIADAEVVVCAANLVTKSLDRGGGRGQGALLPAAGDHAGLRAREARRQW